MSSVISASTQALIDYLNSAKGAEQVAALNLHVGTPFYKLTAGSLLKGIADALQALDTKVDTGVDYKESCRIATAAALPAYTRSGNVLTADANGALNGHASVDGVTLAVGDRVLVKNGASGVDNGIYTVTALGAVGSKWKLTRATDANISAQVTSGMFTEVEAGTANSGNAYILSTANPITLNTTALTFTQFAGAINRTSGTIAPIGTQAAGSSTKSAAADHVHAHGAQALGDGTNHAGASTSVAGFMSAADKLKLNAMAGTVAAVPSDEADSDHVIALANMLSGWVPITPSAARALTTPTAAQIVAGLTGPQVGQYWDLLLVNKAAFAVTLTAGAGVTLHGSGAVGQAGPPAIIASQRFRVRLDNVGSGTEAVSIVRG